MHSNDQAMKLSAAYRCTSILSGTIASLPLIIKRKKDGYFSPDEQSELYNLLTRMPNRRMNSFELMRNAVVQVINRGNAYILIRRKFGSVSELILCANDTVTYDKLNDIYNISDPYNRIYGRFESYDIIHLRNNSLDGGFTGVSTIQYASRVFSIAASADNQNLRTFQNGSKIKGIVSGVKEGTTGLARTGMTDDQLATVGERIENQLNGGRDIISVTGDANFHQLSINPVDAQLLETKKFSVLDICRFYGVHPDKVFAGQSTNYKASEMSNISFLTDTLQPILKQIEAEFNYKLIPNSVAHLYKITFDLSCLYQTDLTTQANYYKVLEEIGVHSPNDTRKLLGLPPVEGGDKVFISCNVQPIDQTNAKLEPPQTK
ncbi:phage portal protein [Phocaeicola sp.]